jgi:hypothetical protein
MKNHKQYRYNEYYFCEDNGMKLRSGKIINCITNSKLNNLLQIVLEEIKWWKLSESNITEYDFVMNEHIDNSRENIKLNNYSVLFVTTTFLKLYYNKLYKIKELYVLYKFFRNKINEFTIFFINNNNKICDYIVEYEDWDYKAMFPIYKEDYACNYDEYNEYVKDKLNFIEELQKWNYKLNIPHSSIKSTKLYKNYKI